MMEIIFGAVLLAAPFVLAGLFEDKKKGFVCVLFFWMVLQTFLAVAAQFLGIFYYGPVVAIGLLADALILALYFKINRKIKKVRRRPPALPATKSFFSIAKRLDWVLLAVIAIAGLNLYQVHYNYTGKINIATDVAEYHEVKNFKYPYPYYSDEWYSVAFINESLNSHSLPLKQPFTQEIFFNLEMFFHSFLAEIFLVLGLVPLSYYELAALGANVLIVVLVYLLLRMGKVPRLASGVASLSIIYIVSGSNLPGMWHFIPVHLGIIFSLLGFCFMESRDVTMASLASFFVLIFYPPLFLFYGLGLLVFLGPKIVTVFLRCNQPVFGKNGPVLRSNIVAIVKKIAIFVVPALIVILAILFFPGYINYIASKVVFESLSAPYRPFYNIFAVIPAWAVLLLLFGVYSAWKDKKWLCAQVLLGICLWLLYSAADFRIIIDYERTVFYTSVVIVLAAGLALGRLQEYIRYFWKSVPPVVSGCSGAAILVLFMVLTPWYTRIDGWERLLMVNPDNGVVIMPRSPANGYLTAGDIKIFSNIRRQRFLSLPWKGTVIGVATNNIPAITKNGTVSVGVESDAFKFVEADCAQKSKIADNYGVSYVYMPAFDCPGYKLVDQSPEGLALYKVLKD
jgi:hypothetical protein